MGTMLKIDDIHVYYGAIHAIKGISLEVKEGEIVTLIGANGAGKSTILRTISGLLKPKTGGIKFMDNDIGGLPAHKGIELAVDIVLRNGVERRGRLVENNDGRILVQRAGDSGLLLLANHSGYQSYRHHHPASGAERKHGTFNSEPRLCT